MLVITFLQKVIFAWELPIMRQYPAVSINHKASECNTQLNCFVPLEANDLYDAVFVSNPSFNILSWWYLHTRKSNSHFMMTAQDSSVQRSLSNKMPKVRPVLSMQCTEIPEINSHKRIPMCSIFSFCVYGTSFELQVFLCLHSLYHYISVDFIPI